MSKTGGGGGTIDKTPIDVVYTWVDKSDPVWGEKFKEVTGEDPHQNRYGYFGELAGSIKSIRKFATFVRRIYLVTDGHVPRDFDLKRWKVTVVDHSEILGEECCRPTFKSNSIETYLWRIPGLSKIFWYFNDDCFLGRRIKRKDFLEVDRKGEVIPVVDFYKKPVGFFQTKAIEGWRKVIHFTYKKFVKKTGKRNYQVVPTHQATIMTRPACRLAYKMYIRDIKASCAEPIRKPYERTIHFVLLSQLVGINEGLIKPRTGGAIPFQMVNYDVKGDERAKRHFKAIMKAKPHMFCLNNLTSESEARFKKFLKKFYGILLEEKVENED